jgi:hypothetical protein
MYAQNQNLGKPNNIAIFESNRSIGFGICRYERIRISYTSSGKSGLSRVVSGGTRIKDVDTNERYSYDKLLLWSSKAFTAR